MSALALREARHTDARAAVLSDVNVLLSGHTLDGVTVRAALCHVGGVGSPPRRVCPCRRCQ